MSTVQVLYAVVGISDGQWLLLWLCLLSSDQRSYNSTRVFPEGSEFDNILYNSLSVHGVRSITVFVLLKVVFWVAFVCIELSTKHHIIVHHKLHTC